MTKNKIFWLIGLSVATFCLFLFFRLYNLNAIPVFVDEGIYVRWSQVMRNVPSLRFLPLSDGKQPLFMWATIPFLKFISDPLIAGRLVSVFAGMGSLLGIGILAMEIFGSPLVGIFSSFIYAVIPFTVFFDRMALADSMLGFFGIWSLIFALRFAKNLRIEDSMYLGFAIGGGLLAKSPAIFFYVWTILALIFFLEKKNIGIDSYKKILYGLFLTFFISQGMNAILRLGEGFQMIGARNLDYVYPVLEVFRHPFSPLVGNLEWTGTWLFLLFSPTVLLLGALGYINPKFKKAYLFLIIISAIPLLAQAFIAKVYTSRYILFAVYPLIPLAGLGLNWLFIRKGLLIRTSAVLFVAVPALLSFVYIIRPVLAPMPYDMRSGYLEEWTAGWGQKEVASYLINKEAEGNKIVVFTEGFFGTLPDGLQIYLEGHKNITVVGSKPYVDELPSGLVNTSTNNLRYFVINSSRNHLKPEDLSKLELIKEYPKPMRSDGTHESLQFFRLK